LREESSRSYSQGEEGGREGGGEEEKGVVLELQRESCALMKTVAHDLGKGGSDGVSEKRRRERGREGGREGVRKWLRLPGKEDGGEKPERRVNESQPMSPVPFQRLSLPSFAYPPSVESRPLDEGRGCGKDGTRRGRGGGREREREGGADQCTHRYDRHASLALLGLGGKGGGREGRKE